MNKKIWTEEEEKCLVRYIQSGEPLNPMCAVEKMISEGFEGKTHLQIKNKFEKLRKLHIMIDDILIKKIKLQWKKFPPHIVAWSIGNIGLKRTVEIAKAGGLERKENDWMRYILPEKKCKTCGKYKAKDFFRIDKESSDGLYRECKECWNLRIKKSRKGKPLVAFQRAINKTTIKITE